MGTEKAAASRRNLIILAATVLVVAAGAWWYLTGRKAVPEEAIRVADRLPATTPLLVWTADIETLLGVAKDAGLDGEAMATSAHLEEMVEALGHNPLTAAGLGGLGIDVRGPLALFMGPVDAPDLLVGLYVPLEETSGVNLATTLVEKLDLDERIEIEAVEVAKRPVAWITRKGGGKPAAPRAAIVDVDDGAILVFPFDHKRRHADRIGAGIEAWVEVLAGGPKETLARVQAFRPALAGYQGGLLGAFFNVTDATREVFLGDESVELSFWILASTLGAGFHLEDDGPALRLHLRSVLASADVAPGKARDLAVLDRIPGRPIAGLHLAVDLEKALAELERSLPAEAYENHALVRALRASGHALGLEDGETALDVVTGELGFFLGPTAADLPALPKASIGFIGIRSRAPVEASVETLLRGTGLLAGAETVDGATLFRVDAPGGEAGVLVEDDRLWFAGSLEVLRNLATGATGELTGGARNKTIAAGMREDNALAIFIDLQAVADSLPGDTHPARPVLLALDYLTVTAGNDGAAVESEVALYAKGGSFRTTVLPQLAAALTRGGFGVRKVEERKHRAVEIPAPE